MKSKQKEKRISAMSTPWKMLLVVLPFIAAFAALCIGRIHTSPADVLRSAAANIFDGEKLKPLIETTLWSIRLPRIILAMFVGAGLSVAGCTFQSLFANPLATPDTLGIASGSSFGAALGILMGFSLTGVQLSSFVFGCAAVLFTVLAGSGKRARGMNNIVLAGIMIGSLFSALVSLVKFTADTESQLPAITYWLMGSLDSAGYDQLKIGLFPIIAAMATLLLIRWRLNVLPLGEEAARSTGVNLTALRITATLCSTVITASCVSMCGQVGWIGLLVPHICRMKFGSNHMLLIPASISIGASFMVVVDTIARSMSAAEFPVSIITAIIGAPFFIILMRKTEGWQI